jgi:Tol biopolymer transport system component
MVPIARRHHHLEILVFTNPGIWIYDLQRDTLTRLTSKSDYRPVWTPDGKYVVYSNAQGMSWTRADGGGKAEPVTQSKDTQYPRLSRPMANGWHFIKTGHKDSTFGRCR